MRAGNASKVSRQHAFIQLRKDGKFYVRNIGARSTTAASAFCFISFGSCVSPPTFPRAFPGRRAVLVNNAPVEAGQRAQLPPDCLLEVGGIRLLFMPNQRIRHTRPASPTAAEPQPSGDAAMEVDDAAAAAPAPAAAALAAVAPAPAPAPVAAAE
jgi:hypothetical protein